METPSLCRSMVAGVGKVAAFHARSGDDGAQTKLSGPYLSLALLLLTVLPPPALDTAWLGWVPRRLFQGRSGPLLGPYLPASRAELEIFCRHRQTLRQKEP